jgi:beta-galactosidase
MNKDSHLAWVVKYTPGAIEARVYRDGKPVLTAKRETTGPAARLLMKVDRAGILADGEDVAMFAVEVQDAQGRAVPVADNEVTFRVSGQGKLIGVGNGDPTSHESDKGTARKAFSGLCMAIVQSTKTAETSPSKQPRLDSGRPISRLQRKARRCVLKWRFGNPRSQ